MDKIHEQYYDILTKEESKLVDTLIALLDSKKIEYNKAKYNSSQLVKFLRARKLDINKSYEMFTNYLKWRKANNIDNIASIAFPELDKVKILYPHGFHKTDKKGRPIYIDQMGILKFDEMLKVTTTERLINYNIGSYEKLLNRILPSCCAESNKYISQTFNIIDIKKLSTKLLNKKFYNMLKQVAAVSQNYYPETLGTLYVINCGLLFKAAWAVCKGFLDEKTRSKIVALGSDYKKKLFEEVDPDNLPKFLGGNCLCEPYGCLFSDAGPWNKENKAEILGDTQLINAKRFQEEELNTATEEEKLDDPEDIKDLIDEDENLNYDTVDLDDEKKLDELNKQIKDKLKVTEIKKN